MKRTYFLLLALLSLFFIVRSTLAQTANQKDTVLLPKGEVVDETYFATGKSVTISGTVNGDVYVAGGTVLIDGEVNGDLLAAGGSITVNGHVTGDVRAAGGQINIDGTVDRNVTAGGGSVSIAKSASIGKGIVIGAGQLSILGPVAGGATIGSGNVVVDNTIGGNVLAGVGQLSLSPNAVIHGNLNYYASQKALFQPGSSVLGKVEYHYQAYSQEKAKAASEQAKRVALFAGFGFKLYIALTTFLIGLIFIKFFPVFSAKSIDILQKKPWTAFGVGALIFFLLPIAVVVLFITIIGAPVAIFGIFIFLVYLYLSKLFVALFLGSKVMGLTGWGKSLVLALFLGLLLWIILTSIPVLGGIINFVIMLFGVGTFVLLKKSYFDMLRTKNLL